MKTINNIRLTAIAIAAVLATSFISPAMANDEQKPIPVELEFVVTFVISLFSTSCSITRR